jgi:NAD+ kinase
MDMVERVAAEAGVELVPPDAEAVPELAVVLGGDGTMLRALHRFLRTGIPVLGVNFGRVGFLTSLSPAELESGLSRVFAGEFVVHELPTLLVEVGGERRPALNDVVGTSSSLGRMIEVGWAVGGEDLGVQPCDGVICATPAGSTAYNLSSGGPVLVWGLDAMVVTFVAPHTLHVRPLVVPRGRELSVQNETANVRMTVVADGQAFAELAPGDRFTCRLDERSALLATPPEATFFRRFREHFAS